MKISRSTVVEKWQRFHCGHQLHRRARCLSYAFAWWLWSHYCAQTSYYALLGIPESLRYHTSGSPWDDLLLVLNCVSVCMLFHTPSFKCCTVFKINADCYQRGEFVYRKQTFDPNAVEVTALHLVSQIRCLCIGYSFGSFQLYSLCPMMVVCSSPVSQDVAVTHFAYMEPENDPRSFVYLWVATGASTVVEER